MTDSLAEAASVFRDGCFQLIRTTGFYERGVYKRLDPVISWHKGDFQPASQADVERLPEGSRSNGAIVLFTDLELRPAEAPNAVADRIAYKGVQYEVSGAENWRSHNRYTLTKVGQ